MSKHLKDKIVGVEKVAPDIYKMTVESPYVSQNAKPGQFINIRCSEGLDMLLRRPISIASTDKLKNTFDIYYQIRGAGTACLSRKKAGEIADIIGPLGNSFDTSDEYANVAVVGGGIGIFPLYFLLKEKKCGMKTAFLGFRDKEHIVLEEEFNAAADKLILATDDGSAGSKGIITQMLEEGLKFNKYDIIYTCGPLPMMKKVIQLADIYHIKCQVSMEQRMGCGIGACLVCACKIKLNNTGQEWVYGHVCKDGPVFWSNHVVLEDIEGEK